MNVDEQKFNHYKRQIEGTIYKFIQLRDQLNFLTTHVNYVLKEVQTLIPAFAQLEVKAPVARAEEANPQPGPVSGAQKQEEK